MILDAQLAVLASRPDALERLASVDSMLALGPIGDRGVQALPAPARERRAGARARRRHRSVGAGEARAAELRSLTPRQRRFSLRTTFEIPTRPYHRLRGPP